MSYKSATALSYERRETNPRAPKRKPMKPVKAWAVLAPSHDVIVPHSFTWDGPGRKGGCWYVSGALTLFRTRREALAGRSTEYQRVVRVEVTP